MRFNWEPGSSFIYEWNYYTYNKLWFIDIETIENIKTTNTENIEIKEEIKQETKKPLKSNKK